jgi:hypothetical protein
LAAISFISCHNISSDDEYKLIENVKPKSVCHNSELKIKIGDQIDSIKNQFDQFLHIETDTIKSITKHWGSSRKFKTEHGVPAYAIYSNKKHEIIEFQYSYIEPTDEVQSPKHEQLNGLLKELKNIHPCIDKLKLNKSYEDKYHKEILSFTYLIDKLKDTSAINVKYNIRIK